MHADGLLSLEKPARTGKSLSYRYDPTDPVPTIGGNILDLKNAGPLDQRPLADRKDVLRFVTEPLEEPLAITGKVLAELHISSDAPDTTFMVKLIDIYPSGYQALVRDSAVMARYHSSPTTPAPLEPGKTYKLEVDMWSTAIVFNKGHRIAVHVQSSNAPKYEVHPNAYEPVDTMDEARVATNTLHVSSAAASCLILPVVPVDGSAGTAEK
jgi:putative CocE/NonD family hydrolase